ncbi:hypothetical protein AK88_00939, partial [Plasmodium fragile]
FALSSIYPDNHINKHDLNSKPEAQRAQYAPSQRNRRSPTELDQKYAALKYARQKYANTNNTIKKWADQKNTGQECASAQISAESVHIKRVPSNTLDNCMEPQNTCSYKETKNIKKEDARTNVVQKRKKQPSASCRVDESNGRQASSTLHDSEKALLIKPQRPVETTLKSAEETLLDHKLITESKLLHNVKKVSLDKEQMRKENAINVLRKNLVSNPPIRKFMLKELEDTLLGNALNTGCILDVLNKNKSKVGECVVDAAKEALGSFSGFTSLLSSVFSAAKCTLNNAIHTTAVVTNSVFQGANIASSYGTLYGVLQALFPSLIAVGVMTLIYIIILYLNNKGKLEWFHVYKRRFIKNIKKKYNEFRMSRRKKKKKKKVVNKLYI